MGAQFLYSTIPHLKSQVIDFSNTGDNTVVAAASGKRVLIHRLMLVCSAATNLTFKRGSTSLSGAMAMGANGGITFDITGEPWFTTDVAEAFVISQSGTAQISGTVYWIELAR
jgi:hypothetical protein